MNYKVSVVIPTCNRPQYLKVAIQSVLDQTFQDFEIVVVDDGVDIRAESVINEFNDNRIKYIVHQENKGGSAARNTGIKQSSSEYIAFLDDDDRWLPEKLEKQYKIMENYKNEIDYTFCILRVENKLTGKTSEVFFDKEYHGVNNFFQLILSKKIRTYTPTLLVKKSVLNKVKGFDESLPVGQEWDLILRISKNSQGYCLNEVLAIADISDKEHIGGDLNRLILGREILIDKYFDDIKKVPNVLSFHYYSLANLYRGVNNIDKAKENFKKSWQINKKEYKSLLYYIFLKNFKYIYKVLINLKRNVFSNTSK